MFQGGPLAAQDFVKLEDIQQALEKSAGYAAGQDANPLKSVESAVVQAAPDAQRRQAVEKLLLEALDRATTREAKGFICRQLRTIGTAQAVPKLAALLADPRSSHMARYALERIEDPAAPAVVSASVNSGNAKNAVDGNPGTRWDTGSAMKGGEWFMLDLGHSQKVSGLVLDARGSNGDYPRGYEVHVSPNMVGRGKLAAKGEGKGPVTEVKFNPR